MKTHRPAFLAKIPRGLAFHAVGAAALFLFWRVAGMPMPGAAGRLIPLAWLLAGAIAPFRSPGRAEVACLTFSIFTGFFWAASDMLLAASAASMVAGVFPAMLHRGAGGGLKASLALLPVAPLIMFTVPFTGDEPYNAALSESLILDGDTDTSDNLRQLDRWAYVTPESGAPVEGISHQQPLFALFISPGVLLGIPGFRLVSLIICSLAIILVSRCAAAAGGSPSAGAAAVLLLPGAASAGLVYSDWTAACLVTAGALAAGGRRSIHAALIVALALAATKIRFAPLGLGLIIAALLQDPRIGPARTALLAVAAAGAFLAADRLLLGGSLFWVRYGNIEFLSVIWHRTIAGWSDILLLPVNALLDQESGLLWRAPWLALAVPGIRTLLAGKSPAARALLVSGAFYMAGVFIWTPTEWHAMPTPTGRFFVALLPLAAVAASVRRPSRPLMLYSIAASSLCLAFPLLRFNHMDGRDALFDLVGRALPDNLYLVLPSMVRPDILVTASWLAAWAVLLVLVMKRRHRAALVSASLMIPLAVLATRSRTGVFEAEDLRADNRIGCSQYPVSQDPLTRYTWNGSRERLLRIGSGGDAVMLPLPPGGGTGLLEIELRGVAEGGMAPCLNITGPGCSGRLVLDSPEAAMPDWIASVRRGEGTPAQHPGNTVSSIVRIEIPDGGTGGVLILSAGSDMGPDAGMFLDRIRVSRRP